MVYVDDCSLLGGWGLKAGNRLVLSLRRGFSSTCVYQPHGAREIVLLLLILLISGCSGIWITSDVRSIEITSHDGVVVDEGKRRKDWNESFSGSAFLFQLSKRRQLVGIFIHIVPVDAVDQNQEQLVRFCFFFLRQRRLNETEQRQQRQCDEDRCRVGADTSARHRRLLIRWRTGRIPTDSTALCFPVRPVQLYCRQLFTLQHAHAGNYRTAENTGLVCNRNCCGVEHARNQDMR